MEVNVHVNIPGLPELADALKTIAAVPSISLPQAVQTEPDELVAPVAPVAPVAEPTVPKKTEIHAPEAPDTEEKALKLEDVREAMCDKQKEVGTPPVRELLKSFGVQRLSELPAEKYQDFLKGLGELNA